MTAETAKHTPGPWTYEKSTVAFSTFPHTISFPDGSGNCLDHNWSEENVRLMAAAPDLLEALKAILHTYDDGGVPLSEAFRMANSAIAKAEASL